MDASFTTTGQHHSVALDSISALGTIVTVWAHPDDETYVSGGLMAIARHHGSHVACVTATDGDFAYTESERRRVAALRRGELDLALDLLGVRDRIRFGLPDGGCDDIDDATGAALVAQVLDSRRPDTVITFGPDGLTGHPDHRAVSRWTSLAVRRVCPGARLLCPTLTPDMAAADRDVNDRFEVYAPGLPATHEPSELALDLTLQGAWLDLKIAALRAHASQTTVLIEAIGAPRYRRWVEREPLIDLENYRSSG
jgi:LmbE family N-acetylglucosaminyl deacetylase